MAIRKRLMVRWGVLLAVGAVALGFFLGIHNCGRISKSRISRGQAAKAIALVFTTREDCLQEDITRFPIQDADGWFVPYMEYLYDIGCFDEEEIPATRKSAEGSLTGEELFHILNRLKIIGDWDYLKKEPLSEALWWRVYDRILESYDTAGHVEPVTVTIQSVLSANSLEDAWQVQTDQGKFRFDGMALDYYSGKTVKALARDQEMIRILEILPETSMDEEPQNQAEEELPEKNQEEDSPTIRVLIQASNYTGKFHESVVITSEEAFTLGYGEITQRYDGGSQVTIDRNLLEFAGGRLKARADHGGSITLLSVERAGGIPSYPGSMQFYLEDQGIVAVNEVALEEYLCRVVPSEMPASYGLEPAKVQAVCARSYAWEKIRRGVFQEYEAHVDDSISYQVYNNIPPQEISTQAVQQTKGEILTYQEKAIIPYYFSTSCGYTTDCSIWGSDPLAYPYLTAQPISPSGELLHLQNEDTFNSFIKDWSYPAYENGYAWFRWSYVLDLEQMGNVIQERLDSLEESDAQAIFHMDENGGLYPAKKPQIGSLLSVEVQSRGAGGIVNLLKIEGSEDTIYVNREITIRNLLGAVDRMYENMSDEGQGVSEGNRLPSAFFCLEEKWEGDILKGYQVYGGGNGHGIGMSQNGVDALAKEGKTYEEILGFFYPLVSLREIP